MIGAIAAVTLVAGCGAAPRARTTAQEVSMSSRQIQGPQGSLAIHHSGAGTGTPVVFLHADAGRSAQWSETMARIGATRPVAALDFRGHGESAPARDGNYSYAARATDVAALADAISWKRFAIVAHSGGSAVALEYAAKHPDRVAGILMVDPPTDPRKMPPAVREKFVADMAGPNNLEALRAFYTGIAGPNEATKARVLADVDKVAPTARSGIANALAEWNPEGALGAYHGPMLVLASPPNDTPAALYRLRTDIPHRIVTDTGHWLQLDQPRIVENAITEFVASLDAGR
jgi:pimeloyl-ACP methyl ester carboxylesterase